MKKPGFDQVKKTGKVFSSSGFEIHPLYTSSDLPPLSEIGQPGQYPFTRGPYRTMHRGRLWTFRQYAGFGSAEDANKRYTFLLSQGQTGLSVAFDLPTQCGYDSDHALAQGETGRVGVCINTVDDMDALFKGIPLDKVSVSMTINATAPIVLAFYIAAAKRRGLKPSQLSGTLQNDILKEYLARGTYIYPPAPSLRLASNVMEYCARRLPRFNPISISGYHLREAGCTAAQEIAFTVADGMAYVKETLGRGLPVDRFAPRLSFFFACHNHFLEEIAKFRAARRLWAKIMRKTFKARNPESWAMRFHVQTAGVTLTAQQPDNNVVRTTIQALAAVLGGAQSLHVNAKDEALSLPTESSALLALRTQQILALESGVADSADPLGGSYALESITSCLEKEATAILRRMDALGGMVRAVEAGIPQREILKASYADHRAVEEGARPVVGVNIYKEPSRNQESHGLLKSSTSIQSRQTAKLQRFKRRRNHSRVQNLLSHLERESMGSKNLLPSVINAVEAGATLGEISDVWRRVYGEHRERVIL